MLLNRLAFTTVLAWMMLATACDVPTVQSPATSEDGMGQAEADAAIDISAIGDRGSSAEDVQEAEAIAQAP